MNTESNAVADSALGSRVAHFPAPPPRPFYWSVQRELWENRSLYIAPLAVAVLILAASLVGAIHAPGKMHDPALDPMQQQELMERPYTFAALLLMFTTFIVGIFYCVEAFQGERRDRSILFWKSLPVSDLTVVLSKASIPFIVLPMITFVVTVGTQGMMLLLGNLRMLVSGNSTTASIHVPLFQMSVMLLYHLVAIHSLWWAPFWGWLLLVSAWARRAAFLWATLPLLAIGILEKIAFRTSYFAGMLGYRFFGGPGAAALRGNEMAMASLTPASPSQFLASPSFWIGLAFAAACLAAAVRLRRNREPI
jgi:ABC-2 type transport system permease protein